MEEEEQLENYMEVDDNYEDEVLIEEIEGSQLNFMPEYSNGDKSDSILKIEKINDEFLGENKEEVECEVCQISVGMDFIEQHINIMHGDDIKCEKCNQIFQSKISLRRHLHEFHRSAEGKQTKSKKKINYCPLCSKEYDYKKQLQDHLRSFHQKVRNSECPLCQKKFYHRDLKKHIENVHGEKRIECDVCGKMYTCVENLKLHKRYHEVRL